MSDEHKLAFIPWRFYLLLALIGLAVLGLVSRIGDLAILKQPFLRAQGDQRALRLVTGSALRGSILDRNGYPLAVSALVYTIWANPQHFNASFSQENALKQLIPLSPHKWSQLTHSKKQFLYLARDIPPDLAQKIKVLGIPGVYLVKASHRYYPEGETTAQLLGWTNVDDQGQEGLELAYNSWLSGVAGQQWVVKDRFGGTIGTVKTLHAEEAGRNIMLSIDRRIQYIAYRELVNGVKTYAATSGSAIVVDVKTGEILAMVNAPSFNPNVRPTALTSVERNRAITDSFEPGSLIKAFTIATALKSGQYQPDSTVDTSPGWMRLGRTIIRDEHDNGVLSLAQILQYSSNMGASKIVLSLPPDDLWQTLHAAGFGETTDIGLPGEALGTLIYHQPWGQATLAALSYGYGLSVTAVQLAQGYMIFANQGIKYPLTLFKSSSPPQGVPVFTPKVANAVLGLLQSIFEKGGTASHISVPGYLVAGKTGTAWLHGADGYEKHRYNASFVGIAPVTNPQVLVLVTLHDPRSKEYLAGEVAGPVFEKIMAETLQILDVAPDAPAI